MRGNSIKLVKRISEEIGLKKPSVDIGGYGSTGMWDKYVKTVVLDKNRNSEIMADCTDMPQVESNFYNTIISCDTLEHVKNPFKAAGEMYRILKPGGIIIITTVLIWDYHEYPDDYFRFTVDALEIIFEKFDKIESGWSEEDVPFENDKTITLKNSGVYFVGRKK